MEAWPIALMNTLRNAPDGLLNVKQQQPHMEKASYQPCKKVFKIGLQLGNVVYIKILSTIPCRGIKT